MVLSVVIVSYNVKFFLEQCLASLKKAVDGSEMLRNQTEVFIIDNDSSDGSPAFLIPLYPSFRFIHNNANVGFAKANNQALRLCRGEFVLFLNPDTIVAEDSLDKCIRFLRSKPDAGAVGVHMIDGSGTFLKESKRGFPTPTAGFFRMSGLAACFPHSEFFARYYAGHLNEKTNSVVDILSGAFMMIKKTALEKTGSFDERFFMYAEDIDLSYRIFQAGFRNYYLAETTIIHFKGESTRKDSHHVKIFYSAMELFMKKHSTAYGFSFGHSLLIAGVRFRQALAILFSSIKKTKAAIVPLVYVNGQPEDQREIGILLSAKNIPRTETEKDAQEIIFCESPLRSWKSIIEELPGRPGNHLYKFHGKNTHAAVGSPSAGFPGHIYELITD